MSKKYDISAFYFPNFHKGDKHNSIWHGKDWTEWNLMKEAKPRFEGHEIPVPLWGYEDESDPEVMERKIETAVKYGVNNFLFDWYYYDDGPFLNDCIDSGFLNAKNVNDIKFSLMWANHDWLDIHPLARAYVNNQLMELKGTMKEESFLKGIDYIIDHYFIRENYYRIDGALFLSIYEINKFVSTFGSIERAKDAIKLIRKKVRDKGLGELHLNAICWGVRILAGESAKTIGGKELTEMGFDSVTSYVWTHEHEIKDFPKMEYSEMRKQAKNDFEILSKRYEGIRYFPNVSTGWDPSPRTLQTDSFDNLGYPYMGILVNNTKEEFKKALERIKEELDNSTLEPKMFTINAWNEWTEGSYLEPDTKDGYAKLEAIKEVFKD